MCDEDTEAEAAAHLAQRRLKRRAIGKGTGAVAAAWIAGCKSTPAPATEPTTKPTSPAPSEAPDPDDDPIATRRDTVAIETPDGTADALLVTPTEGRHPGVIVWPDIAGLRDAFADMATRLATTGYAVLVVNQYYRSAPAPVLEDFAQWRTEAGRAKIDAMLEPMSSEGVARDGAAFARWLHAHPSVEPGKKLAVTGYCMGGPFTIRTAAASARVGAVASFHGGGLVTDAPDSPHRLLPQLEAAALICVAENDDARRPETKAEFRAAAEAAGVPIEIEVYPAKHGWCVPDSPVYDHAQAERAFTRTLATFNAHL